LANPVKTLFEAPSSLTFAGASGRVFWSGTCPPWRFSAGVPPPWPMSWPTTGLFMKRGRAASVHVVHQCCFAGVKNEFFFFQRNRRLNEASSFNSARRLFFFNLHDELTASRCCSPPSEVQRDRPCPGSAVPVDAAVTAGTRNFFSAM